MSIFELTAIVSLLAAWLILLLMKVGVIEWAQVNGSKLVSELASCHFCLSWWSCVVITLIIFVFVCGDVKVCLVPFMAAPITRQIIR